MKDWVTVLLAMMFGILVFFSCGKKDSSKTTPAGIAVVTGRVTEADSTVGIAGVRVYEKGFNESQTLSDSAGYFVLENVKFDEHPIYFEKEGYETDEIPFSYTGRLERPVIPKHAILKKK